MADHNELGALGENLAVEYLSKKGYRILGRNYRFKKNELDILAQDEDELVIVEVKTRNSEYLTDPSLLISKSKQNGIIKAANAYIDEHEIDLECRFDVVVIVMNQKGHKIDHIQEAFYPTL